MEDCTKNKTALELVNQLAEDQGEMLDEPVLDYLSELLVFAADDEAGTSPLSEALTGFLPLTENIEQLVELLVKQYHDGLLLPEFIEGDHQKESELANSCSLNPDNSEDCGTGSDQYMDFELMAGTTEDMSASVANIKLSPLAKEFVPLCVPLQEGCASSQGAEEEHPILWAPELDSYAEDTVPEDLCGGTDYSGVDGLGLLSCLYPSASDVALQSLLDTHNGDLGLCIRIMSQMNSGYSASGQTRRKPIDLSEDSFPSLPSLGPIVGSKTQHQDQQHKPFVAALKKKASIVPNKNDNSTVKSLDPETPGMISRESKTNYIPWVETGEKVSKQYSEAREEAREFARRRNAFFEQATKAYLSGNKALAKELGIKGRWCCDRMKDCHAVASEAIFQERNMLLQMGKDSGPIVLDLHGLHVSEAERILKRELERLALSGKPLQTISLLVGTGHHTKGARTPSRLPYAVSTFLDQNGYAHKQGKPGVIEVRL